MCSPQMQNLTLTLLIGRTTGRPDAFISIVLYFIFPVAALLEESKVRCLVKADHMADSIALGCRAPRQLRSIRLVV